MVSRFAVVLGFATLVSLGATARAEPRSQPHVSVTLEPLYLVITTLDVTTEVRVAPHFGLAAITGYGRPLFGASLWNLGGQANAYLMREFTSLHVRAEL